MMYPTAGGGRWTFATRLACGPGRVMPCNKCEGCHKTRVAQWVVRLGHEAQFGPGRDHRPLMVTLTFANAFLPSDYSVRTSYMTEFIEALRRLFPGARIRFYGVGEYGSTPGKTRRPHFHIIIFGCPVCDLTHPTQTQSGFLQYKSPALESCWTDPATGALRGFVEVSFADRATFSYVAGYVHARPQDEADYWRVHPVTGEALKVERECSLMSRRPGIGGDFCRQFLDSDARGDFVVVNGEKRGLPTSYRRRVDALDVDRLGRAELAEWRGAPVPDLRRKRLVVGSPDWLARKHDHEEIERLGRIAISGDVEQRQMEAEERYALDAADLTPERLAVRREAQILKAKALARGGSES